MKLKLLAAALVVAFATNANANSYSVGNLSALESYAFGTAPFALGAFSDTYAFSLSGTSEFSGFVSSSFSQGVTGNISGFSALLTGPGGFSDPWTYYLHPTPPKFQQVLANADTLLAGLYTLTVSGTVLKPSTTYSLNLSATPAVPEAETYGMFLAGLGLMGFIALRRTRNNQGFAG